MNLSDLKNVGGNLPLFDTSGATATGQEYAAWKALPGAGQLLRIGHAIFANYVRLCRGRRRKISAKLVWEILRFHHAWIVKRREALGVPVAEGFRLNNNFTAYFARDLVRHRPEWESFIELREIGKPRRKRKVLVIEETITDAKAA